MVSVVLKFKLRSKRHLLEIQRKVEITEYSDLQIFFPVYGFKTDGYQ